MPEPRRCSTLLQRRQAKPSLRVAEASHDQDHREARGVVPLLCLEKAKRILIM